MCGDLQRYVCPLSAPSPCQSGRRGNDAECDYHAAGWLNMIGRIYSHARILRECPILQAEEDYIPVGYHFTKYYYIETTSDTPVNVSK